jgi:hypothetical protein
MTTEQAALVFVVPDDDAESVVQKVLATGAQQVNLLVSDAATALRDPAQALRLQQAAEAGGVEVILISGDPATLAAAQQSKLVTLAVSGSRVLHPGAVASPPPEPRASESGRLAADLSDADAAFLNALDDLDAFPAASRDADADFAADLDNLDFDAAPPPPRQRVRPEDIELSVAERQRAASHDTASRATARPQPSSTAAVDTQPIPRRGAVVPAPPPEAQTARNPWLIPALSAALIFLLLAIGAVLLFGDRTTVTIAPPARVDAVVPVPDLPLPIASPGMGGTDTAIEAEALASNVAFGAEGVVSEGTLAPSGTANGVVTILSLNNQPITLPAGTEFIAVQPNGQEVPFVSGADVVVPSATTQDTGAQVVTSRGQIDVAVSARSAGSASNVDANSIRRMILPDGQSFNVDAGTILVRHNALVGGSESEVRIVKDSDVQPVLAAALTGLDADARRQLAGLASAAGLALEETTISPRRSELEQLQGFEAFVSPAVGETLDPNNPAFSVTVQARYAALATPAGRVLEDQIPAVFTEQLRQAGLISPGDCRAPFVTDWNWNGAVLTVDGEIRPDPACGAGLDAAVYNQVREAVRGKSRAEAAAALDALVAQGVIGSYTLPDRATLPGWDWQIRVE